MTNADKYLKEEVKSEDFAIWLSNALFERGIAVDVQPKVIVDCLDNTSKPQLTEDERVILRNIDTENFKAIGRKDVYLYLRYTNYCYDYGETDIKTLTFWYMYHKLFQFIKERRRILY